MQHVPLQPTDRETERVTKRVKENERERERGEDTFHYFETRLQVDQNSSTTSRSTTIPPILRDWSSLLSQFHRLQKQSRVFCAMAEMASSVNKCHVFTGPAWNEFTRSRAYI